MLYKAEIEKNCAIFVEKGGGMYRGEVTHAVIYPRLHFDLNPLYQKIH